MYNEIIKTGNRMEISRILNTLMKKRHLAETTGKKFGEKDSKLLEAIQSTLFSELAMSLNTTFEAINQKVLSLLDIKEI